MESSDTKYTILKLCEMKGILKICSCIYVTLSKTGKQHRIPVEYKY